MTQIGDFIKSATSCIRERKIAAPCDHGIIKTMSFQRRTAARPSATTR
jgi:hypothetical protein